MNSSVEDKKTAVPNNIKVEVAVKSKKKSSRRYSIRRFASAGMISQVRRPFLYFLAIAIVALVPIAIGMFIGTR